MTEGLSLAEYHRAAAAGSVMNLPTMNLPTMNLPTGTVTFLFSDIEGSTRILQELGDAYAGLLEAHAAIIRAEVSGCAGIEVSTEGDAFFCVFTRPPTRQGPPLPYRAH